VHKSQQLVSIIFILQDVHQRIVGYAAMVVACRHRQTQRFCRCVSGKVWTTVHPVETETTAHLVLTNAVLTQRASWVSVLKKQ